MIVSEEAVREHNLTPLARLVGYSVAGVDPTIMGIGPVYAIRDLLQKASLSLDNIDLIEVRMYNIVRCVPMVDWNYYTGE